MLKPRKRITKKELKQDQLITTYVKAVDFFRSNRKMVSGTITGLVIAAIVIVVYLNNRRADNLKAATELSQVLSLFNGGAYQVAINGDPARNIAGLKSIVESYGGSESGEQAKIYLADCYYYLGDYDNALKYFKDYDGSDKLLEASADAGIAEVYEVKGDYRKSAEYYDRAASRDSKNFLTPQYLVGAARSYIKIEKKDKATELLTRVRKNFPDSPYAMNLDYYMAEAKIE
ncbi:MAG TPA: tetratricopeptide repeat protein [Candidatus Acidoferrales bacterium]|nr:tetratricopeptide repeat protein [Candidatus Acidoferrales bacterium]